MPIDALIVRAEQALARGDEAAAAATLAEAEALFPVRLADEPIWQGRFVMLHRTKAALAQMQNRSEDAVAAFEAALFKVSADPEHAGRDANAARLQLLVRLARSRLALGQAAEVAAEMRQCETIMAALAGRIPSRAIDTVRAAVFGNAGLAHAMQGELEAAKERFAASIEVIDRVAAPELSELRRQVMRSWQVARRGNGRAAEAGALPARSAGDDTHDEHCGCGHGHRHDSEHHHRDHDRDDHHHGDCGCAPHAR